MRASFALFPTLFKTEQTEKMVKMNQREIERDKLRVFVCYLSLRVAA